jgi:hypothetical protein
MTTRSCNQTDIKFTVTHGECNGLMHSRWFVNNVLVHDMKPNCAGTSEINFVIDLPAEIIIEVSNKNLNTDTMVDSQGRILKDKFLKVDQVHLARLPIGSQLLEQLFEIHSERGIHNTSYFGFPGTVKFVISEADAMTWHLRHNHYKVK